jgi:hypothetical protein
VFIDPEAGNAIFRAEAEAWPSQRIGAHSNDGAYKSARGFRVPRASGPCAARLRAAARAGGMPKIPADAHRSR